MPHDEPILSVPADQQDAEQAVEPTPVAEPGRHSHMKALMVVAFLIAAAIIVYCTPLKQYLNDREKVRVLWNSLGPWAYPAWVVFVAALISIGTPRLIFCFLGGALMGFWPGLLVTQIGTLIGYYCIFLFVRWGGRSYVQHRWPKLTSYADMVQKRGILGVILIRQVPLPCTLTNLCLGLSHLKHRQFWIGSAIGVFPEAIPVTLLGAGFEKSSLKHMALYILGALVAFLVVAIGAKKLLKRLSSEPTAAGATDLRGI